MNVEPKGNRSTIKNEGEELLIETPAKKYWSALVFLFVWFAFAVYGEIMASGRTTLFEDSQHKDFFQILWDLGWKLGITFVVVILLWSFFGKEKIVIDREVLTTGNWLFGLSLNKRYELDKIRNLVANDYERPSIFVRRNGAIKFDYGSQTIFIGSQIAGAEGRIIIEALRKSSKLSEKNFA